MEQQLNNGRIAMIKHHRICQRNQSLLRLSVLITLSLLAKVACATVYFKPLLVIWYSQGAKTSSGWDPSAPVLNMALRTWSTLPTGLTCAVSSGMVHSYKPLMSMNGVSGVAVGTALSGVNVANSNQVCYGGAPDSLSIYDLWADKTTTLTLGGPVFTIDFSTYNASQTLTAEQFSLVRYVHPIIYLPDQTAITLSSAVFRNQNNWGSNEHLAVLSERGTPTSYRPLTHLYDIGLSVQKEIFYNSSGQVTYIAWPDGPPNQTHTFETGPELMNQYGLQGGNYDYTLPLDIALTPSYLLTQQEPVFYVGF